MDGRLKQGFLPWNAPIGYNNNGGGKFKTPDPERAPFIRLAFELYATQEYSFRRLLTELQNRGFRNRSGKLISKGCLENIMSNPFYHGLIRIKCSGDVYQGGHEPLIPEALFSRVQDIKANKQIKKSTLHNHSFRHLIKCSQCARSLIGERQKAHVYYRCHTKGCATSIREDRLEAAIASKLMELKISDTDKRHLASRVEELLKNHSQQDEHQAVRIQLGKVAERLDQLTDALLDQLIDKPTFQNRKATLLKEQASLQNCLREQVSAGDKQANVRKYLELIKSLHLTYGLASSPQKRRIADMAMSNFFIEGKNLYFKPRKWLCDPRNTVGVLYGAHSPDRTRVLADLEAALQEMNSHTISNEIA